MQLTKGSELNEKLNCSKFENNMKTKKEKKLRKRGKRVLIKRKLISNQLVQKVLNPLGLLKFPS